MESGENARMLNKDSSGMRDWTVWWTLNVGLTCLHESRQHGRAERRGRTNRIRCSTSAS